jgi:tol-pal system protein YbgF
MSFSTHFFRSHFHLVLTLAMTLSACAPPPSSLQPSNLTLDMRRMQAALDRQGQEMERLSQQVTDLQALQENQAMEIEELRQTQQTAQAVSPAPVPTHGAQTSPQELQQDKSPTEVYLQAFGDYASGRYQASIQGFESFLQLFPNNSYASNAQYWLADSYFNQQQYATAIEAFQKVLVNYVEAPKSAEALYKMAVAHLQLEETEDAQQAIDQLNARYPKSSAAQKAQELVLP